MSLILGSPLFMAPELIRNEQNYNEKVDIWALGCFTYQLLSRKNPFNSKTVEGVNDNILVKELSFEQEFWNNVSKECKDFIS